LRPGEEILARPNPPNPAEPGAVLEEARRGAGERGPAGALEEAGPAGGASPSPARELERGAQPGKMAPAQPGLEALAQPTEEIPAQPGEGQPALPDRR
jgi:hypothetical protein